MPTISIQQVIFAAVLSFLIWGVIQIVRTFIKVEVISQNGKTWGEVDLHNVMNRCHELFPIATVSFHGTEFHSGMRIRITTTQQNVIEGELIGMNKINMVCIRTEKQIIAHQLDKIQDMTQIQ